MDSMIDDTVEGDALKRLRRIEGQVIGVQKMIKERRYCMDIVNQVSAVEAALHRVSKIVLRNHIKTCVLSAFRSGDTDDVTRKVDELMRVYDNVRLK
ncbi:MAG: metal-sensitive transcriptional regulator [Candidatus Eisenbacteria bacterium]